MAREWEASSGKLSTGKCNANCRRPTAALKQPRSIPAQVHDAGMHMHMHHKCAAHQAQQLLLQLRRQQVAVAHQQAHASCLLVQQPLLACLLGSLLGCGWESRKGGEGS